MFEREGESVFTSEIDIGFVEDDDAFLFGAKFIEIGGGEGSAAGGVGRGDEHEWRFESPFFSALQFSERRRSEIGI